MARSWAGRRWKTGVFRKSSKTAWTERMIMLSFFIGLLTVILALDCLLLILLILIQLPKKEAGAGIAFGGGATDALFGAGSGTALTKITKYSAGGFLALSLVLSVLRAQQAGESGRRLEEELRKKSGAQPVA